MNLADTINTLVGTPYSRLDCYALMSKVFESQGKRLPFVKDYTINPAVDIQADIDSGEWKETVVPSDGCAVAMGNHNGMMHCGIHYRGYIFHATRKHGAVVQTIRSLKVLYPNIKFYEVVK